MMVGDQDMGQVPAFFGQGFFICRRLRNIDGDGRTAITVVNQHAEIVVQAGELVDLGCVAQGHVEGFRSD